MSIYNCSDLRGQGPSPCELPIPHGLKREWHGLATRRHFLRSSGKALVWASLASLLGVDTARASTGVGAAGVLESPQRPPRAKRVIDLFM